MPKTNLLSSISNISTRKKPSRKKVHFKKMTLKLTESQFKALEKYCRKFKTTPVRHIKMVIGMQVERYRDELPPPNYATSNQLELF